jgi:hypothetical protein
VRLHPTIVVAVLAAFFATTAVPGPGIVAHTHAGGDHEHAHDFLAFAPHHLDDEDDDDHDHDHHHHHCEHHDDDDDDHALDLTEPDHDPLHHTHVSSPFQPATKPAPPIVFAALRAAVVPTPTVPAAPAQRAARVRSRGPPSFASV